MTNDDRAPGTLGVPSVTSATPEAETNRTATVSAAEGLHARPAAEFAKAAAATGIPVTLRFGTKTVNAASILGVLSLGVMQGDEVVLSSTVRDADGALDALVTLLESSHD